MNIQDRDKAGRTFTRTECVMEQGALFGVRGGDTGRVGVGNTSGGGGRETLMGVGGETLVGGRCVLWRVVVFSTDE